jgi:hypothetical protein
LVIETFATGTGVREKLASSESVVAPDVFGTVCESVAVLVTALEVFTVTVISSDALSPDTNDGIVHVTVGTPPTSASLTEVETPSVVTGAVPAGEPYET